MRGFGLGYREGNGEPEIFGESMGLSGYLGAGGKGMLHFDGWLCTYTYFWEPCFS